MHFQFTSLVKAYKKVREFNFTKPSSAVDNLFHVDVSDDKGHRIMFKMQKEGVEGWKIVGQEVPEWIREAEGKLV